MTDNNEMLANTIFSFFANLHIPQHLIIKLFQMTRF